jgi:hypothetical protein
MRLSAAICVLITLFGVNGFGQEKAQRFKKIAPLPSQTGAPQIPMSRDGLEWFDTAEGKAWQKSPQGKAILRGFSNAAIQIENLRAELVKSQSELIVAIAQLRQAQEVQSQQLKKGNPDLFHVKSDLLTFSCNSVPIDLNTVWVLAANGRTALIADGRAAKARADSAMACVENLKNIFQEMVSTLDTSGH